MRPISAVVLAFAMLTGLRGFRAEAQPWPLWKAYTQKYLDDQGRVIDRSAGDRTTSEGQAYAMFFALVANDRAHFNKLLKWTEANLAGGDLTARLPGWDWGKTSSGEWKLRDANSASDADLWMAYTLLEAGRLWHDAHYESLGRLMAARIAKDEVAVVPGVGTALIPGPRGFHPNDQTWVLNPSYLPPPLLAYFAKSMPEGPWAKMLETLPRLLSGDHGFAMDWLLAGPGGVHPVAPPAEPSAGRQETQPSGSYDAIRVYLWLGIADPMTHGQHDLLAAVSGMGTYLKTAVIPPTEVDAQGNIVHAESPVGFSAALIPYLTAIGEKPQASLQQHRLIAAQDPATGLYGHPGEYYDQNLALFSTGWSDQRYRFDRDGKLHLKWR